MPLEQAVAYALEDPPAEACPPDATLEACYEVSSPVERGQRAS
jgi:hypothetical protein